MLNATKRLSPPEWMKYPETVSIMEVLNRFEDEPAALFVGGCVRNMLFDLPVDDIDIASRLTPEEVTKRLENASIKVVPTGIEHGTVTAVVNNRSYEITTLRKDIKTDGRHAKVEFTTDWQEDAKRRDFTINTLLADIQGNIFDILGYAFTDISRQAILFVGDPRERIQEDYLRILRFFRFHANFGRDDPDREALAACKEFAPLIDKLSKERITQEFMKVLGADNPAPILIYMKSCNVLDDIMHERFDPSLMQGFCELQDKYKSVDLMARYLVLGLAGANFYSVLEKRFIFSVAQKKNYTKIKEVFEKLAEMSEIQLKIMLYKHDKDAVTQAAMLHRILNNIDDDYLSFIMHIVERWEIPKFPISGQDLIDRGIKEGPELGKFLNALENWWMLEAFKPNIESCNDMLNKVLKEGLGILSND